MSDSTLDIVYLNKGDGGYAVHVGREDDVRWSDGKTRVSWVSICGSVFDVAALEHEIGTADQVTCRRCRYCAILDR